MKKKTKLVSLVISFCMMLTLLIVGVFAARNATVPMGGTINFTASGINATIKHKDTVDGSIATALPDIVCSTHNQSSNTSTDDINKWNNMVLTIAEDKTSMQIVFTVKNDGTQPLYIKVETKSAPTGMSITTVSNLDTKAFVGQVNAGETNTYYILFEVTETNYDITDGRFTIDVSLSQEDLSDLDPSELQATGSKPITELLPEVQSNAVKSIKFLKADKEEFEEIQNNAKSVSLENGVEDKTSSNILAYIGNGGSLEVASRATIIAPENCSRMFSGMTDVTEIDLSNFDTSNVTDMSSMFSGCTNLRTLNVSSFDTSKVTDMSDMFSSCSSLKSLDLSNFNTSKVNNMQRMFQSATSLEDLDVSNFDTSNAQVQCMFQYCSSLVTLDLTSFSISSTTYYCLANCGKLQTVYGGDSQVVNSWSLSGGTCDFVYAISSLVFDQSTYPLSSNGKLTLTPKIVYVDGYTPKNENIKYVWTSSDTSIATVDENGVVTALSSGSATITAKRGVDRATCTVTIA